jgi:hypothetical protein
MRKTINSRGEHETEFTDGHKMHVSIADAKKLLARYETLRLPNDKLRFTVMAASSMKNFKDILAHGLPKETKKKISLGGKQFKEFYLGVGRTRTIAPYPQDSDEPPGTRRVAEASTGGVDPDENDDPNKSRKTNQKLDLLLRLGLADGSELQKYRRALRSSKKQALQSPEMRKKLADLLDKLIDLTTGDPTTFSRVRQRVMTKEAMSLLNKAEMSGVDVDIIFEVFSRGYNNNEDINEAFSRVNSFIAGGKAVEMDSDLSEKRGLWDNIHAKRERIKRGSGERMRKPGSKGSPTDAAIKASQAEDADPCWKDYKQIGMKMKNGRSVPNCVPKESNDCGCGGNCNCVKEAQSNWAKAAKDTQKDKVSARGTIKRTYVDRKITPFKADMSKDASSSIANFMARGGIIKKIAPGKKTISAYTRPKKYMTPNLASRITEAEATSSNKNDPANRFVGTDEVRKNYASATPGQEQVAGEISVAAFSPEKQSYISPGVRQASSEVDQSKQEAGQKTLKSFREALSGIRESNDLNEAFSAGFELAPLASDYGIRVQSAFEHHPQVQEALDAQKLVANETVEEDKKGHRSPSGGLTQKGRDYYNRQSGGNLKAPVTTEPSKLKTGSKAANRRKSFCARMGGMKKRLTSAKTANDPDSRINKALRKWNC